MADRPRAMRAAAIGAPPPHDADTLEWVDAMLDRRAVDTACHARYVSADAVAARAARADRQVAEDWADLARYRAANAAIDRPDLVMIGDSLTEIWGRAMPDLFDAGIVNRGIAGQTSPQILLRFMADVVALRPSRVHILCGTNDIAGNTGPTTPEDYQRNMLAMIDLAAAHGIAVLLASIPPAATIAWSPDAEPLVWIPLLNQWLADTAATRGLVYLDYWSMLRDEQDGLREEFSADGVHLTRAAYIALTRRLRVELQA